MEIEKVPLKHPNKTNAGGIGPVKYQLRHLPEGWQNTIIEMASQGCCEKEIRAAIKIRENTKYLSEGTWNRLIQEEPEFADVVEQAKIQYDAWWLRQGRTNLANKNFNGYLYVENMKRRQGWVDTKKHEIANTHEIFIKQQKELEVKVKDGGLLLDEYGFIINEEEENND